MVFTFLLELLIYLTVFFLFVSVSARFIVFARRASSLVVPISLVVLHFARRLATVPYRLTLAAIFAFALMPPFATRLQRVATNVAPPTWRAVSLSAYRRYARPHSRASISPAPRAHTVLPNSHPPAHIQGMQGLFRRVSRSGIPLRDAWLRPFAV